MSMFSNTDNGLSEQQFMQNLMSLLAEVREVMMKSETERLRTYGRSLWPARNIMSPKELASAVPAIETTTSIGDNNNSIYKDFLPTGSNSCTSGVEKNEMNDVLGSFAVIQRNGGQSVDAVRTESSKVSGPLESTTVAKPSRLPQGMSYCAVGRQQKYKDCCYEMMFANEEKAKGSKNLLPLYSYTDHIGPHTSESVRYLVYNIASNVVSVFSNTDGGLSEQQFVQNLMSLPAEEREARMRSEAERLRTFGCSLWPIRDIMSPEELAAAGFYYTGVRDRVRCAFCRGVLQDWMLGDTAMDKHRLFFGYCRLVMGLDCGNIPIGGGTSYAVNGVHLGYHLAEPAADQRQSRDVAAHRECSVDTKDELQGAEASVSDWNDNSLSAAQDGAAASEDHSYHEGHCRCHSNTHHEATRHTHHEATRHTHHEATRHTHSDLFRVTQAVAVGTEIGHQRRADIVESRPMLTGLTEVAFIHEMRDSSLPSAERSGSNQAVLLQVLDDNELDDPGEPLNTLHRAGSSAVALPSLLEATVTSTWAIPLSVPAQVSDGLTVPFHEPQPHFSVQATSDGQQQESLQRGALACVCCHLRPAIVSLVPCRHMVLCLQCESILSECPMCSATIKGYYSAI